MSSKIKVAKFGGTSLGDAGAILRSARIAMDQNVNLVVVSAVGGVTNQLIEIKTRLKQNGAGDFDDLIESIEKTHMSILGEIEPAADAGFIYEATDRLKNLFRNYQDKDFGKVSDEVLASGEMLSSELMCAALKKLGGNTRLFDARDVIKTDSHHGLAHPDIKKISKLSSEVLIPILEESIAVTQGFIGQSEDGLTTTLGRGGSDYSAALFAEAINADELQIWTDVPGIATADPKIVKSAEKVHEITFQEAAELATAGAKILHSRTISPTRRANIPIYVGNSFSPETEGTRITKSVDKSPIIRAITIKPNQSIIRITAAEMAEQFGYLARILDVFSKYRIILDQISTSEITVAFAVDSEALSHKQLLSDLEELGDIKIENDVSAISLIGNNINSTPGLVNDIFNALESEGDKISVRMICQGASKHNICFFVLKSEGEKAVKKIHKEIIEGKKW